LVDVKHNKGLRVTDNANPGKLSADLDFLQSVIGEQQSALEKLTSRSRDLETVLHSLLLVIFQHPNASAQVNGNLVGTTPQVRTSLSQRELQVLKLMVEGKTSKEIAAELGIRFKTAVTHRASILSKLEVHETASAVREAIRTGLV